MDRGNAQVVAVGAGWIGRAVAASLGTEAIPRRGFGPVLELPPGRPVVVASGRSSIPVGAGAGAALRDELIHLRLVLDAAERAGAPRIVVLGSSDVAGMAAEIDATTPQDPRTTYAEVKAALEDECVLRHQRGVPVTCVRLAPAHGPGKARSRALVRLSRLPLVPLPNGGRHSTGFVLLADAVRAIHWLIEHDAPAVQAVGAGHTPLRQLLAALAEEQGRRLHSLAVPVPATAAAFLGGVGSDRAQWALRLASPRAVRMDPPIETTSLTEAARMLVHSC